MDDATCSCILGLLKETYPHACDPEEFFLSPFKVVILTILSAQTTDAQVWALQGPLFERYPTAEELAVADTQELEALIRPTGYYHAKARHLLGAARMLVDTFGGVVPATMEELVLLPGVGRKTANIVLYHAFGKNEGIAVDTHVLRLSRRIGYTMFSDPARVERDLMACHPRDQWGALTDLMIAHGRAVCTARRPRCADCVISRYCRLFTEERAAPSE